MYNPHKLRMEYRQLEHGKAREAGIREAIKQADKNGDVPFQIYFRIELCDESCFYGDDLDMMIVFPELLAIADKNPEAPATQYNSQFKNAMAAVLWTYKWLLISLDEFYQISNEDAERFLEDFKQRSLAFGYNLRPYYKFMYEYHNANGYPDAEKYFHLFESTPMDRNADCKACEQNFIVEFYLKAGNLQKAQKLAQDLETKKLSCGGGGSWLRLKKNYMIYYISQHQFEEAEELAKIIHRNGGGKSEFDISELELLCYSYLDIAKALQTYKKYWKTWNSERNPDFLYSIGINVCVFFKKLMESRKRQTIKIAYDGSFPLYRETNTYAISELYDYYYKMTADIAKKFDTRGGTHRYMTRLINALNDVFEN